MSYLTQLMLPIVWHDKCVCDIMIFDEVGSDELSNCIPSGVTVNLLKVREGRPLLKSLRFFLLIFINLVKYKNISIAQYAAIITIWKPKILITHIDNSLIPGNIQEIFPNLFVFSIQNGFRGDFSQSNIPNKFGYFFAFGSMGRMIHS